MSLMNYRGLVFKRICKILAVVLLLGGCASQPKPATQESGAALEGGTDQRQLALISNISVEENADSVKVVIKGSEPLTYEVAQMESPLRLIIDVAGAQLAIPGEPIPVGKGGVSEIVPSEFEKEGKKFARVEIGMSNMAHYEILPTDNDLWVDFPKAFPPLKKAEKILDFMIDDTNKDYVEVDIIADGTIESFNSFNLRKPTRLVIDFPKLNLLVPVKQKKSAGSFIKKARWGGHTDYLRLVMDSSLSELPSVEVISTIQGATIFLGTGFEGKKSQLMSIAPSPTQSSESLASSVTPSSLETKLVGEKTAGVMITEEPKKDEAKASPEPPASEAQDEAQPATPPGTPVKKPPEKPVKKPEQPIAKKQEVQEPVAQGEEKTTQPAAAAATAKEEPPKYKGTHISLDFQDADIRNILRLIADVSNLNIIAGEDVQGKVTIKLNDVPWDQALDVILLSNDLGKSLDGNILRVAPIAKIEQQRKAALSAQESQAKLEPLKKGLIPISYAKASELKTVIQNSKVLSPRGGIEIDPRTNTLIVMDIEKNIEDVKRIIENLDTPTPQVLIEAKIIQINPTYTHELGVSWDASFKTTAKGAAVGGAGKDVSGTSSGITSLTGPVLDFLPAVGPGAGASLALGWFRDNFNIAGKIAAMEKDEKLEIISSPRVMTLDNQEAMVEQGTDIPYLKLDTGGTYPVATTEFKKVTLSLKVTPHVTADGSIIMDIEAKKDQLSAQTGADGQPGIDTRKATTKVLVRSGVTVVIGGIYEDTNRDMYNSVPFFGRIPVLNFFFRGTSKKREKSEMIVFITPTIVTLPKKQPEVALTPVS